MAPSRRPAPVEATDFVIAQQYICSIPERDIASVTIRDTRNLGAHTRASANESNALDPAPDVRMIKTFVGRIKRRGMQLLFPR